MAQDGPAGCECIREAGGQILAQDEASSVVWGIARAVTQAGLGCQSFAAAGIANGNQSPCSSAWPGWNFPLNQSHLTRFAKAP